MKYLHEDSHIGLHGNLTSRCCVIDRRWILKVSDFGLERLFKEMKIKGYNNSDQKDDLLYYSPERLVDRVISPAGDVYSFAIIACQVVCRKEVRRVFPRLPLEDIVSGVSKNGMRPHLTRLERDIPSEVIQLIGRCWSDRPEERLSFRSIASCFRRFPSKGLVSVFVASWDESNETCNSRR